MPRLVVLTSSSGTRQGYDIRLGPLHFVTPADVVGESVGDGLDTVGAALVAPDRRPRPLKLKLPVRGYEREADAADAGVQLRRQVRSLFDNAAWRLQGFYFMWAADPDLDGWLLVGGADLSESDPGISFGEFEMEMSDVYIVGRSGTHRPGRRAVIADRRSGAVARDTRRLLLSTDFATQDLPDEPLVLPGDIVDVLTTGNREVSTSSTSPAHELRSLWRTTAAVDGEVLSYRPDPTLLPGRDAYLELDEVGSPKVWDLSDADVYPPDSSAYSYPDDTDPEGGYGWRRVLGDLLTPDRPIAVDNGACRLIWLGPAPAEGLALEYWDEALGHFRRAGRLLHAANVREQRVIEANYERVVIEWRAGQYALRAILQRGWWGPRLESYNDGGGDARIEFVPEATSGAAVSSANAAPTWVKEITAAGAPTLLWATGSADEVTYDDATVLDGTGHATSGAFGTFRTRVLVAQLASPGGAGSDALASLSLADARAVPVLIGRR